MKTIKNGLISSKVIKNSFFGVIASIVSILSTYATRVVFSRVFGESIYGINSLFGSIVSALLIIELGISSAMVIFMYKPIAENDQSKIKTILKLYRRLYFYICSIIFVSGIVVDAFFLHFFVHTDLNIWIIRGYFLIYLISIIAKYVWSYKRCILFASNNNKISSIFSAIIDLTFMCFEILVIVLLKNYLLYLCIFIFHNVGANVLCTFYVNKHYPFVKEKDVLNPTKEDKRYVFSIVSPMFVQRISNQLQDSSSPIIYGALGYSAEHVGFYSNYLLVIHAIETLFNQVAMAITSSLGCSFVVNSDPGLLFDNYKKSRLYMTSISLVLVGSYLCFIDPFIKLFFGENYVLGNQIVILTTVYLFLLLNNEVNKSVQNALGAHKIDTVFMIAQAVLGIGLSVLLGFFYGLQGILVGLIASFFVFSTVNKGRIIYKKIFLKSPWFYYLQLLFEIALSAIALFLFRFLFSLFDTSTILLFVLFACLMFLLMSSVSFVACFIVYRIKKR